MQHYIGLKIIKNYLTDDSNGINWIKIGDAQKNSKYINTVKEHWRVLTRYHPKATMPLGIYLMIGGSTHEQGVQFLRRSVHAAPSRTGKSRFRTGLLRRKRNVGHGDEPPIERL